MLKKAFAAFNYQKLNLNPLTAVFAGYTRQEGASKRLLLFFVIDSRCGVVVIVGTARDVGVGLSVRRPATAFRLGAN